MDRSQKTALVIALAQRLQGLESWCGETHLQKATYFLQTMMDVPLDFQFVLYKHGPFSFDLREELTSMRADGLLEIKARPAPYGPSLSPSSGGVAFSDRYPRTLGRYEKAVGFVANKLADKGVSELERLATALLVTKAAGMESVEARAKRITSIKPHVTSAQAEAAVLEVDRMRAEAAQSA